MGLELHEGISFCTVDGTAIFLDLVRNRYFALSRAANERFLACVAGEQDETAPAHFPFLRVSSENRAAPAPPYVAAAERSLVDDGLPRASLARALGAAAEQLIAAGKLRRHSLYDNLTRDADIRRQPAWDEDKARLVAASFQSAGRLIGITDRCLRLSFAMWRRMRRVGIPATLVFGVTNRPFAAHCWVQSSGTVCSDRLEHVRWFTPIAAL